MGIVMRWLIKGKFRKGERNPSALYAKSVCGEWDKLYFCSVSKNNVKPKHDNTMKRTVIISALLIAMTMAGMDANAQPREHRNHKERTECRMRPGARKLDKRHRKPEQHRRKLVRCAPPRVAHGCYVPGWEGRVRRHRDGRWAYRVNGSWVYYNCYYDPRAFFCEPLPPAPRPYHAGYAGHASAGEVAAGVMAGTVVGCIIGALAR